MKVEIPENCLYCDLFQNKDDSLLCNHWHNGDVKITDPRLTQEYCPIKTETLNAVRYRVHYRGEEFYLVVSELDGMPWEIFIEVTSKNKADLPYMISSWNFTTRLVTMALKTQSLGKVVRQCTKSSYVKGDLPYTIGQVLTRYLAH